MQIKDKKQLMTRKTYPQTQNERMEHPQSLGVHCVLLGAARGLLAHVLREGEGPQIRARLLDGEVPGDVHPVVDVGEVRDSLFGH